MLVELLGGATLAATGALAWGVRGRSSTLLAPSFWRGPSGRRALALTFDDGPSESTPRLLELLERHNARATFFQCGFHVRRLPEAARAVLAAGHEIGNHTETHPPLYFRSAEFIHDEIRRAQDTIAQTTGRAPTLFRAPFGARWFGLREAQHRCGLTGVMWSTLARDWSLPAAAVAARLRRGARPGAILCLHDGRMLQQQPDIRVTLEALGQLLPEWRDQGFELIPVSELLCLTTPLSA